MKDSKSRANPFEQRIGLFWFVPLSGKIRFFSKSSPLHDVPTIGGFKTHPTGHVEHWETVLNLFPELRGIGYEYFPRGRVNWREEDGAFLLMADKSITLDQLHATVIDRWNLGSCLVELRTDSHYRVNRLALD